MNEDLKRLYRELEYTGPLPGEVPRGDEHGLQPLDENGLTSLEKLIRDEPQETIRKIRDSLNYPLSEDEIRDAIVETRRAFTDPKTFIENRKNQERARGSQPLPEECKQYPDIEVDPDETKLEPKADAVGWAVNTGVHWLRDRLPIKAQKMLSIEPQNAPFASHDEYDSKFTYTVKDKNGQPLNPGQKIVVALFGDFGSGLYYSKFIAKKIAEFQPHYAIHLGDVYYAGRSTEFENNFQKPLDPLLKTSQVFALNANHEMMSGGFPYFGYLNYKRSTKRGWVEQDQEGSYFCIRNENYQLIGIDTAYHGKGHNNEKLQSWLGQRLHEGKNVSPKRMNILLSQNEPYSLGQEKLSGLYHDLKQFIDDKLIDFWFWGNTHYGALFGKTDKLPFVGGCLGHGGHPIYREDIEKDTQKHRDLLSKKKNVTPINWVELTPRFPNGIRPELGNNGFCMMELEKGTVRLTYYDWLGIERFKWENS